MKDVNDVRENITKNFLLKELTISKIKPDLFGDVDSARIKECLNKDREKYLKTKDDRRQKRDPKKIKIEDGIL